MYTNHNEFKVVLNVDARLPRSKYAPSVVGTFRSTLRAHPSRTAGTRWGGRFYPNFIQVWQLCVRNARSPASIRTICGSVVMLLARMSTSLRLLNRAQ